MENNPVSENENAINDFSEADRCLAFGCPTAAGFHAMRAVETDLRDYWTCVVKPKASARLPRMARCIKDLKKSDEDPNLIEFLDIIRDLGRNTIMHPGAFLTMEEALNVVDIAKHASSAMANRIKIARATGGYEGARV